MIHETTCICLDGNVVGLGEWYGETEPAKVKS